jgi:predicted amidohydrolase
MIEKEIYEKYQKAVSITCVNFNPAWGNKAANLEKIKSNIEEAAKQGNDIVVFGEMALVGFECDEEGTRQRKPCTMHEELAETIPGPTTREIAQVAKDFDIYVVFGMAEREKENTRIRHNTTVMVGPEGLVGAYRKINLSPSPTYNEEFCCLPGKELPVFETKFGIVGMQICYDFWYFPELSRILALKGARLIINTAASPAGPWRSYYIAQQTGCRATENMVYAATANLVGKERIAIYSGSSVIAGPLGTQPAFIYAQGSDNREEFVSATLDFKRLQRLPEIVNWKKDRKGLLIAEEMQKFT